MKTLITPENGKVFAEVVFLMAQNPENDRWEAMAYFPNIPWNEASGRDDMKLSYMHNGQHGPCCDAFALVDCIAPRHQHLAAVARLKNELTSIGYILTELDSKKWIESKGTRRIEIEENIREAGYVKDSEALLSNGKARKNTEELRAAVA